MSNRTPEKDDGPVVVLDCEWLANLKEKVEKTPMKDERAEKATIFRVPNNIRASDTYYETRYLGEACNPKIVSHTYYETRYHGEAYNPKIVSLGPYHHLDERLQVWNNRLKWPSLKKLLERSPEKTRALEQCIDKIKESEREVRSEYAEEVEMTSNAFVEMMLLDCCFVLELLLEQEQKKKREEKQWQKQKPSALTASSSDQEAAVPTKESKKQAEKEEGTLIQQWQWAEPLIGHDLLMLENQIPLSLLRELHGIILGHDNSSPMDELILSFFKEFSLTKHIKKIPEASRQCYHLLHLLHSCLTPIKQPSTRGDVDSLPGVAEAHMTSAIPCARDLIESQVEVKKKPGDKCSSFLDLSFNSRRGLLEIPEIHIDDGTNTLLRNLIAFEQCLPSVSDHLTTYAWFMDSVIDNSADVALLRRKHVLVSGLGSDEEVAKMFNSLCKEVMVDHNQCYLNKTIKEVNKYYSNKFRRCCAILNHNYFSNPWAGISVVAAIILFVLTFLQTLYSICGSCSRT